jgi:hypothetical protein
MRFTATALLFMRIFLLDYLAATSGLKNATARHRVTNAVTLEYGQCGLLSFIRPETYRILRFSRHVNQPLHD